MQLALLLAREEWLVTQKQEPPCTGCGREAEHQEAEHQTGS